MGTGQLYIRRNVWSLDPTQAFASEVTLNYAKAVRVMQQRDRTDPTSWSYQAAIHGTPDPVPPGAPWNQCQHSTWYFLPWHRMYLWFFEQVVREAIAEAGGDPTGWALPYWNYSDGPQPPVNTLPLAFRVPTLPDGSRNALHLPYPLRNDGDDAQVPLNAGINDGGELPPIYLGYQQAFQFANFTTPPGPRPGFGGPRTAFSHGGRNHGALESRPHDGVHPLVGGMRSGRCQRGLMGDPDCAARDPIFWLHHANVDRLWDRWLDTEGHSNPDDGAWRDRSFRFYDPGRQELRTMTVGEVLDAVDYRYDDEPPPVERPIRRAPAAAEVMAAASADERRALGSTEPLAVAGRPVLTSGRLATEAAEMVARVDAAPAAAPPYLSLNLEGVQRDEDSALLFEVYLNLPPDVPPDPLSVYYVGYFAFFDHLPGDHDQAGGHHHPEPEEDPGDLFVFDITNLANEQRQRGIWSDSDFTVTVVRGGYRGPEERLSVADAARADTPQLGEVRIARATITAE